MMRVAWSAFFCAVSALAQVKPLVRVTIQDRPPIIAGQPVHIRVLILAPNYFTGSPQFPQLEIANAVVVLPEETPQNSNESIAGESYAGITRTYVVYPQQPGRFVLPPKEVIVPYADKPPHSLEVHLPLPATSFVAFIPAAAADLDYFLPTSSLTLRQVFDKPLKNLKAGDTVKRTVTVTASKLQAMLIPPAKFEASSGISVYARQPVVTDVKTDRGEFVEGKRVDSATYLIRQPGDFELPEISFDWWDIRAGRVRRAVLPAVHFNAAPNPAAKPDLPPEPEPTYPAVMPAARRSSRWYWRVSEAVCGLCLLVMTLWWIWSRFGSRLQTRLRQSIEARRNSEGAAFARLKKAIRMGDAKATFRLLLIWLNRVHPGLTLDAFLFSDGDADLTSEVNSLAACLYGRGGVAGWSGKLLMTRLERTRTRNRRRSAAKMALPPLNP